ncbi:MAG: hypothetical protein ABIE74_00340 [Pseudomonadota bacterium]
MSEHKVSLSWKISAIAFPLIWLTELHEYLTRDCVSWANAGIVCGDQAILPLFVITIFCFSFPIIYLIKRRKLKKEKKFMKGVF